MFTIFMLFVGCREGEDPDSLPTKLGLEGYRQ